MLEQILKYIENPKSLERLGICSTCEHFTKENLKCKLCGCHMPAKVLIPIMTCPAKKW